MIKTFFVNPTISEALSARHVLSEVSPTEHAIRRRFVQIIMPRVFRALSFHLLIHNKQVSCEFSTLFTMWDRLSRLGMSAQSSCSLFACQTEPNVLS